MDKKASPETRTGKIGSGEEEGYMIQAPCFYRGMGEIIHQKVTVTVTISYCQKLDKQIHRY